MQNFGNFKKGFVAHAYHAGPNAQLSDPGRNGVQAEQFAVAVHHSSDLVVKKEILGEIPLNFTLKTMKQDLPIYLAVVNVYLQDFVNLAALGCLERAVEGIFDLE